MSQEGSIIICCADKDLGLAQKLLDELRKLNKTFIMSRIRNEKSINVSSTIVDCKLFMPIVSHQFFTSKNSQEELSLAFFSDRDILPIGKLSFDDLFAKHKVGIKLQLERCDWVYIFDEIPKKKQQEMIVSLTDKVNVMLSSAKPPQNFIVPKHDEELAQTRKESSDSTKIIRLRGRRAVTKTSSQLTIEYSAQEYWTKHFNSEENVSWDKLYESFSKNFSVAFSQLNEQEGFTWTKQVIGEVIETENDNVSYNSFIDFCTYNGSPNGVWETISGHIAEAIAVKRVFDVESQFRVNVVEQLGKYHSNLVISSLLRLLKDANPNVISVAIISLSKTGVKTHHICTSLLNLTKHSDRLVRQSACLALGKLQYSPAITRLIHIWRNDFISVVRDSAHAALKSIGGVDAEQAVKVTRILEEELKDLSMK